MDNLLGLERNSFLYTPFYCEENIWQLCNKIKKECADQLDNCYAIFISNLCEMVPLWAQNKGNPQEDYLVVWDYHVIMAYLSNDGSLVYDFDTILPFPCTFKTYAEKVFRQKYVEPKHGYSFRVVKAQNYLDNFSSDRSRMKNKDGSYIKPPPDYPCIKNGTDTNNLNEFILMSPNNLNIGKIMNLEQLCNMFNSKQIY